jgi:hypothetical protein
VSGVVGVVGILDTHCIGELKMGWKSEKRTGRRFIHIGTGGEVGYELRPWRKVGFWSVYFHRSLIGRANPLASARHLAEFHSTMRTLQLMGTADPQKFPCLSDDGGITFGNIRLDLRRRHPRWFIGSSDGGHTFRNLFWWDIAYRFLMQHHAP